MFYLVCYHLFCVLHLCRKFHEPLPVVPLKVLAHNELVGRVIGKKREREREREREIEKLVSIYLPSLLSFELIIH